MPIPGRQRYLLEFTLRIHAVTFSSVCYYTDAQKRNENERTCTPVHRTRITHKINNNVAAYIYNVNWFPLDTSVDGGKR